MTIFHDLLSFPPERVVDIFYSSEIDLSSTQEEIAAHLNLNSNQLICALGFNRNVVDLLDIIFILGYESINEFLTQRNRIFISDIYQNLSLKEVLSIYDVLLNTPEKTSKENQIKSDQFTTKLLSKRLGILEHKIENTVKPQLIENYRAEVKTIYKTGSVPVEFIKLRLENKESGFRALLDEVNLIVTSRVLPIKKVFLHDSVLPEEKRRLISRGLIAREWVKERLESENLSNSEREILENYLYETN